MPELQRTPTQNGPAKPVQATGQATATEQAPTQVNGPAKPNSFLADLLAGRMKLDGNAADWFSRGVRFQRGMKGELIKKVQAAIGAQADGDFGAKSEALLKNFQKARGMKETGTVDRATWDRIEAAGPALNGEADFARMWANHPHNYQDDPSQNTSSADLVGELGLTTNDAPNTCALRMSTMLNRLGGGHELTEEKGKAAGLDKMRSGGLYMPKVKDPKTEQTQDRVILSAKEMWTYLEHKRGRPDLVWPPRDRYKTEEEATQGAEEVKKAVAGKKGFIAFDHIFGYGGSGHVDIFNGEQLSDGEFYPSARTMIWFVVK